MSAMSSTLGQNSGESQKNENDFKEYKNRDEKPNNTQSQVVNHYNSIEEKGLSYRNQSRIVYLRNFNNWIKSMLLAEYLDHIKSKKSQHEPIKVLDLCCGKGGDLNKWHKGNVSHLVCVDIAENSVISAQKRYNDMKSRNYRIFTAEFIVADLTKERVCTMYKDPKIKFDIVSCQFAFHYCFESLQQAEMMLKNITDNLLPGGYFIGTIPNAFDIIARKQKSKQNWFGNTVFTVTFEDDLPQPYPLFGAKYNFHLHESVDCPEFLVHFPTFERLAARFGLKLVKKKRFQNYYDEMKRRGQMLLNQLNGLETYPPLSGVPLLGPRADYSHAKEYFKEFPGKKLIGTLSQSEWEVCSLYMIFAFQKVDPKELVEEKQNT
ncbi:mRNA cap guanine-N7 methyltransferase [Cimex lectularius]|uniref:mRNA cap guanine-N(7) methyltransferase n=1 Tax=Cimex lectularius TaxID=79782 RepID=A0A8I6RQ90_CIMLE|nr:mRNA cap guanine-N7 methyltransferase [Cimex lectularius]